MSSHNEQSVKQLVRRAVYARRANKLYGTMKEEIVHAYNGNRTQLERRMQRMGIYEHDQRAVFESIDQCKKEVAETRNVKNDQLFRMLTMGTLAEKEFALRRIPYPHLYYDKDMRELFYNEDKIPLLSPFNIKQAKPATSLLLLTTLSAVFGFCANKLANSPLTGLFMGATFFLLTLGTEIKMIADLLKLRGELRAKDLFDRKSREIIDRISSFRVRVQDEVSELDEEPFRLPPESSEKL